MRDLKEIALHIKESNESVEITPRELFEYFDYVRRAPIGCRLVDDFLRENDLEVRPHYNDVWFDTPIVLRPKEKAKKRNREDPIKRLAVLKAANIPPLTVDNSDTLEKAITLMMLNKYSQLPVVNNRKVMGYISWETIGEALAEGETSQLVKDYKRDIVKTFYKSTPLLKAIRSIYKHEFIVVVEKDNTPCGIVTATDISSQFLSWTEPFVLMEQIENLIRVILDEKILLEDLRKNCQEKERTVDSIDDLTFGEYIRILGEVKNWKRLGLKTVDRSIFVQSLERVREIRNSIMHFDPDGLDEQSYDTLRSVADYLNKVTNYKIE